MELCSIQIYKFSFIRLVWLVFILVDILREAKADSEVCTGIIQVTHVKDGAYFSYYAYVLCISRYSGFIWAVPTNTGIFLHGLKLC